ncbi:MAG TPA: YdcF family protein [Burkholderiaceae bacterium]|nr:YdcF family protein [Burkholderiaceae bacterium]
MIADWLTSAGLGALKPVVAALVLPPVPFLVLVLAGLGIARSRPRTGRLLAAVGCVGLWLGCCIGAARWVEQSWLSPPPPLDAGQRAQLKARAAAGTPMAIVVLGGGMDADAREYGSGDLASVSLQRLRYGVWLGRQTGIPVAGSGGLGWAQPSGAMPEAERMAQIARDEYGLPLRWVETASRDTHENAGYSVALLRPAGVAEIVLVTSAVHMPRALREFRAAAASTPIRVTPAPMGAAWPADSALLSWMPSGQGALRMHAALHEVLGALTAPAEAPQK